MKIAMIGQKGAPATYGGIERHVDEISRRLVARGHEVSVYCRPYYTPEGAELDGVTLLRRPSVRTKHLDAATHTALCTLESLFHRYDVVHFHALGPSLCSWLPRLTGARTVVTVHGLDWQREKWGRFASWCLRRCEYSAVNFPNRTIVVSETLQEYFRAQHSRETVFIPNGTNLPTPRAARKILSMGLEPGKYVLFVGRLVPEKGVHYLCEAFSRVPSDLTLAIAGGLSFSADYASTLRRWEGPRVKLLDYVVGEPLEELWSNAYLVVLPSTMEGLSIALLEALSYGRCVLMSDIPENLEVADGVAPTFRNRDVDDLTTQLAALIADPARVRAYEARSRQRIEERYSWERVVADTEAVYRDAAARR